MSWLNRVRNAIPFVAKRETSEHLWHKCKGCSYQINDNPAYRNAKAPINWGYCCEACRLGLGHGGWCQHITK